MAAVDTEVRVRGFWAAVHRGLNGFADAISPSAEEMERVDARIKANRAAGRYDERPFTPVDQPDGIWGLNARAAQAEFNTFGRASYPSGQPLTAHDMIAYRIR